MKKQMNYLKSYYSWSKITRRIKKMLGKNAGIFQKVVVVSRVMSERASEDVGVKYCPEVVILKISCDLIPNRCAWIPWSRIRFIGSKCVALPWIQIKKRLFRKEDSLRLRWKCTAITCFFEQEYIVLLDCRFISLFDKQIAVSWISPLQTISTTQFDDLSQPPMNSSRWHSYTITHILSIYIL